MSNIKVTFKTDVTKIATFNKEIDELLQDIVDKAAYDIKGLAQEKIPVDTGAAKNSIYVKTSKENTQSASMESARIARAKGGRWHPPGSTVELVFDGTELKPLQALVGVAVVYGMALEYGTLQNSNPMSAHNGQRPYLTPSVMEYRETFIAACRMAIDKGFRR